MRTGLSGQLHSNQGYETWRIDVYKRQINLYVTASDMNALIEEYKEEAANETIEEDIYPDGDQ